MVHQIFIDGQAGTTGLDLQARLAHRAFQIDQMTTDYLANIDTAGQSDGSAQGDIAYAFYDDYYSNPDYRSNISVDNIDIGGTSLGSAKVEGILIQYLDVRFRDLEP